MLARTILGISFLIGFAASATSADDQPVAVLVDGASFSGKLVAADKAGQLTLAMEDGQRKLFVDELVRWGCCAEPDRDPVFLFADGSLLTAGILQADATNIVADSDCLGTVRLPVAQLSAVIFRLPASRLDRDLLLDDALHADAVATRVVLLNGDEMRGRLVAIGNRSVSLQTAVGSIELDLDRISALTFASPPATPETPSVSHTIVGLTDGSRIATMGLLVDGQTATIATVGGLQWETKTHEIVFLQPASARIVYLSDLKPIGYRHVPYLDQSWPFRIDRNVLGGMLRCAGEVHLKGVGMHTAARLSYAVPGGVRQFQAVLGIDDATEGLGSVRFRVFVDDKQQYASPTIRGRELPIPIAVNVFDAQRIDLVVDFADRADVQDHASWLDARFVR